LETEASNLFTYVFAVSVFCWLEHKLILSIYFVTIQSRTITGKELCKIQYGKTLLFCCGNSIHLLAFLAKKTAAAGVGRKKAAVDLDSLSDSDAPPKGPYFTFIS